MINYLNKTVSLNNLKILKPQGQIATLLILIMVVMLIFILTIINLGQVSLTATTISNAADAATLSLASSLATKSRLMAQPLGFNYPPKQCKSGGMASLVFAIVLAVIAIVVIILTWPVGGAPGWAILAAGTAGGAVGGAAGASYAGTPVVVGAIQGAMIGASIGYGAGAAFGSTGAGGTVGAGQVAGSTGATVGGLEGETVVGISAGNAIPAGSVLSSGTAVPSVATAASAIALHGLGTAASLYNASVAEQNTSAAFAAAAKALSGLPEYDRIRESAFLQAFMQTVDDPNKYKDPATLMEGDPRDLNGNGDTTDKISNFLYWWDDRITQLKDRVPVLRNLVRGFVQGTLKDLADYARSQYAGTTTTYNDENSGLPISTFTPGLLSRQETEGADGQVANLARSLYNSGYRIPAGQNKDGGDIFLLQPGTTSDCPCETCGEENFSDGLQAMVCKLRRKVETIEAFLGQDPDRLADNWQSWVKMFYDPETTWDPTSQSEVNADLFDVLKNGIEEELRAWIEVNRDIDYARQQLPVCEFGTYYCWDVGEGGFNCSECLPRGSGPPRGSWQAVPGGECLRSSVPCRSHPAFPNSYPYSNPNFQGTIDTNASDQFTQVDQAITNLIAGIDSFCPRIEQFYNDIQQYKNLTYSGTNPATYSWADSRGNHSITVEVSNFRLPSTRSTESGNFLKKEYCLELVDYYDFTGDNTWVRITRQDPVNREIRSGNVALGRWNPFSNGTITKRSKAHYDFQNAGLIH